MDLGLCEAFELTCIEYLFHFAGSLGLLLLCSMKGLFERNEDKYRNHIATCNLLKAAQSADWPFLPLSVLLENELPSLLTECYLVSIHTSTNARVCVCVCV